MWRAGGHGVAFFAALSDTLSKENILLNETNEALLYLLFTSRLTKVS
jgi:hypothetical protein